MMKNKLKGRPIGFDTIKRAKTLLRLQDGNYLQCELVVNKIVKADQPNPMGEPIFMVNTTVVVSYWTATELAKLEESSSVGDK